MADREEIFRVVERAGKSLMAERWTAADGAMLYQAAADWIELNAKAERAPAEAERAALQTRAREVLDSVDLSMRTKLQSAQSLFIKAVLPDLIRYLPRLFSRLA